jgi:hypothetical protein
MCSLFAGNSGSG